MGWGNWIWQMSNIQHSSSLAIWISLYLSDLFSSKIWFDLIVGKFLNILRKQSPLLFAEEAFSSLKHSSIKYTIMLLESHTYCIQKLSQRIIIWLYISYVICPPYLGGRFTVQSFFFFLPGHVTFELFGVGPHCPILISCFPSKT